MRRTIDYGERGQVTVSTAASEIAFLALEELAIAYMRAEKQRRSALVALSGGSTPKRMYEVIREPKFHRRIIWSRMQLFWGDERWVPIDDEQSNAGEARRGFIDALGLSEETWHPWPTYLDDPNDAAEAYESSIRIVAGALESIPEFDLILLGMGDDGHTASLFPGTAAIHERARITVAHDVPKLDATRLTMTPKLINNAKEVLFLVNGAAKAEICLLYTSDAADDLTRVDLGGRRIIIK